MLLVVASREGGAPGGIFPLPPPEALPPLVSPQSVRKKETCKNQLFTANILILAPSDTHFPLDAYLLHPPPSKKIWCRH